METTPLLKAVRTRDCASQWGFRVWSYRHPDGGGEHLALVLGEVTGDGDVLVRVHTECVLGDVLGLGRCRCRGKLDAALHRIRREGTGVLVYLRMGGDASHAAAGDPQPGDCATTLDSPGSAVVAAILRHLGVRSPRLLTNTRTSLERLRGLGLSVSHEPLLPPSADASTSGLAATRMGLPGESLRSQPAASAAIPCQDSASRRPEVTLTYAQSLDGSITVRRGESMVLSCSESLALTHELRARHDAILVGIDTVLVDDPRLTVRLVEGTDPQAVVLDSRLRTPLDARLLRGSHPPWIATTEPADPAARQALEERGARVLPLPPNREGQVDLYALLQRFNELGVGRLMVEGGAKVITSFLAAGLVDRIVLTIAPILVGGLNAVANLAELDDRSFPSVRNPRFEWLGETLVLSGDVVRSQS